MIFISCYEKNYYLSSDYDSQIVQYRYPGESVRYNDIDRMLLTFYANCFRGI